MNTGHLSISHIEALRMVIEEEEKAPHSDAVREELPAIISHWLKSGGENLLLLPPVFRQKWSDLINSSRGIGPGREMTRIDYSELPCQSKGGRFTFIDLFAGIGGFHQALGAVGGDCIFSSEWEPHAKESYFENYGTVPFGDITRFCDDGEGADFFKDSIPVHDILAGGFPCQAFSQAGRGRGFQDARGTLFFEILKIATKLRPKILILENVKRLKTHDGGKTFKVIINSLRHIGYKVYAKVLRARDFDLPQNRERIFIVAFSDPIHFEFPKPPAKKTISCIGDILDKDVDQCFTITDRLYQGHLRRKAENVKRGKGFGFSVFAPQAKYTNTISARYWKDGSEILIEQVGKNPRMLTPRECARLQGFPEHFRPHKSKRYAYQQFGNSVAVKVVQAVAEAAVDALRLGFSPDPLSDPLEPVIH